VDDLDALLDRLKQEGVKIDAKRMNESYGRFAWIFDQDVFRLGWKWKERSAVKITERTREKDKEALHRRRKGRHLEATLAGWQATEEGAQYLVRLPSATLDAAIENQPDALGFVDYLRLAFEWGGFSGLRGYPCRR
jgi:hypothetical protein